MLLSLPTLDTGKGVGVTSTVDAVAGIVGAAPGIAGTDVGIAGAAPVIVGGMLLLLAPEAAVDSKIVE